MTTFALLVAAFITVVLLPCMAANFLINLRRPAGFPPASSPMPVQPTRMTQTPTLA